MSTFDNLAAAAQTQTGALATRFRGETCFEDPLLQFWRNAGPVVLNLNHHPPIIGTGAQDDLTLAIHCVRGVLDQVGPDLIEFAAIRHDLREIRSILLSDADALFEFSAQDQQGAIQSFMNVDALNRCLIQVNIGLVGVDDIGDACGGAANFCQQMLNREIPR